jgi:lysozyme family protein
MANFKEAYEKYILPNEGGYGWLSGDSGGETYAGIARNYNPNWDGWAIIDLEKQSKNGGNPLPNNTKIPSVMDKVFLYYNNLWDKNYMGIINSQNIANTLFDMLVNAGGNGVKLIQRIINTTPDGVMGPNTVSAINRYPDQVKLYNSYNDARREYYNNLALKYPQFIKGWLNRLDKFPVLSRTGAGLIVLLFIGLVLYLSNK